MAFDWIEQALSTRREQGYWRAPMAVEYEKDGIICIDGKHYLNFSSNDYLGMRHDEGVLQTWVEGLAQFGGGSGASALITGYTQAHQALEAYLAEHLQREAVLLFNSGFAANQALTQALFAEPGTLLADKLMHASFVDGAQASDAQFKRFAHNDLSHLSALLSRHYHANTLIATEGVFSMDGDSAPLRELSTLAADHHSWLMVDDAHGFGVLGETGMGSVQALSLSQAQVPVVMGTFGKAVGTAGAFVAGSRALIELLVNTARHYIYSTAMPPSQALATLYSLQQLAGGTRQQTLADNIDYFRQCAAQAGLELMPSNSAIQPVLAGSPQRALALSNALRARGMWVPAIRYPTVPKHTDRLRVTLSSVHTQQDLQALCDALVLAQESLDD